MYESEIIMSEYVVPPMSFIEAVDLEWPFCVSPTVLAFCGQNSYRHKCTAETLASGDIMFYGIIVHPLNHFRLSNCQPLTVVYRLRNLRPDRFNASISFST